jgi:hypothetical protein
MKVAIKPNSFVARIAAKKMGAASVAIVFGKTIFLWNHSVSDFLKNKNLLRHEAAHVRQYQQYGFLRFIFLYLKESVRHGYFMNRFEVEAREMENQEQVLDGMVFYVNKKLVSLSIR